MSLLDEINFNNINIADALNQITSPPTINNISRMIDRIQSYSMVLPFKYEIAFNRYNALQNLRLCVSCESCAMPGKTIATQEIKYHGPVYEMPYEESFSGDMDAVFKISGDMFERKIFEEWQSKIINPKTHNLGYLDEYSTEIEITQLDHRDKPIYRIVLEDAWPKTIGPIEYGDEKAGEINKQTISFSYRKWKEKDITQESGWFDDVLGRLGLGDLFDSSVPMIPTAIGGHIVNLPYGLDPGQITQEGINILGDWLGQFIQNEDLI